MRIHSRIIGLLVGVITLGAMFGFLSLRVPATLTVRGVVQQTEYGWGIENNWVWHRPLAVRKITLAGLPLQYQQVGQRLTVVGTVVTRGSGAWTTSIVPTAVNGERLVQNQFGETVPESLANTNISQAQLHDQQVAEAQARALWDPILTAAQTTEPFSFGGLTFSVPTNMLKQTVDGSTSYTFPVDLPEGPYIAFSTTTKTADQFIADKKAALSIYETVVQDTTEVRNGITWRVFEQTTDFGINQIAWIAASNPHVVVQYAEARADVQYVLEKIVRSGRN
jgi:hypothetical protein